MNRAGTEIFSRRSCLAGLAAAAAAPSAFGNPLSRGSEPVLQWRIGDVRVTRFWEQDIGPLDPLRWFPDATPKNLSKIPWLHPHFVNADGSIVLGIPVLLIEAPGRRILVDTGLGDIALPGFPTLRRSAVSARDAMAARGIRPDEIDTVVHSHLHADHIGGDTIVSEGRTRIAYPRARYVISKPEYAFWKGQADPFVRRLFSSTIEPLEKAAQIDLVDTDAQIAPAIHLVSTPGHTPGHVSVRIASRGQEALITGDMMHHPLQFAFPDRGMDQDEKTGAATRRRILSEAADKRMLVIGTHFLAPTAGRVERAGSAFRFIV